MAFRTFGRRNRFQGAYEPDDELTDEALEEARRRAAEPTYPLAQVVAEMLGGADPEGLQRKGRAHYCSDWCHDEDRVDLQRRRQWAELVIVPPHERLVLPVGLKHWCGRHCTPLDPETPVRLGRGRPDPYDRTPVRCGCGGWMRPGQRHYCRGVA